MVRDNEMTGAAKRDYKNILVNQLNNIGDVLLATSAIALIRQAYPDARITLLAVPRVAVVFKGHPLVNEVLPFAYQSKGGSLSSMWQMVQALKKRNFDLNISLDFRLRPLLVVLLAGIPERISGDGLYQYKQRWYRCLFTRLYSVEGQYREHQTETFLKIARQFLQLPGGVVAKPSLPPATAASVQKAKQLLGTADETLVRRTKVLFCVRGTHPEKNWPQAYFAQVIDQTVLQYQADCYIIGAPDDYDYAQEVLDKCGQNAENLCGRTEPTDLTALFEQSDLLVTVDTGSAHMAATTSLPIVSIFLCTNPIQWRPLSDKATILCYKWAFQRFGLAPADGFVTQETILPQHVMQAIAAHLDKQL